MTLPAGSLLAAGLPVAAPSIGGAALTGFVVGIVNGSFQWTAVRGDLPQAWIWIPGSGAAGAAAAVALMTGSVWWPAPNGWWPAGQTVASALITGGITGALLVALLVRARSGSTPGLARS